MVNQIKLLRVQMFYYEFSVNITCNNLVDLTTIRQCIKFSATSVRSCNYDPLQSIFLLLT